MSAGDSFVRRHVSSLLGAAFVLVVGVGIVAYRLAVPSDRLELAIGDAIGGRVVVLPVVNATAEPEQAWVRLGLMEMLAESLARTPGIEVVPPERLARAIAARGLTADDEEIRRRIRQLAHALGGELLLDLTARRAAERRGAPARDPYLLELTVRGPDDAVVGSTTVAGDDLARLGARAADLAGEALVVRTEPARLTRVYSASPFLNRLYGMGVRALAGEGPDSARRYFEIVAEAEPRFLAARLRLAECDRRAGRLDAARKRVTEVVEEAQNRGDRAWERRALLALATIEALDGHHEPAARLANQVRSLATGSEGRPFEALVLRELVRFALGAGDETQARALLEELLELETRLGDRLGRIDTLAELGSLALGAGDAETAEKQLEEGRALAAELDDVWAEMRILASLGEVAHRRGDFKTAVERWQRAATFYEQRGEPTRRLLLEKNAAEAMLVSGDLEGAEDAFLDVLDLARERGDRAVEALASLRLAFILLRQGYPYQARPHLERAIALDTELGEPLTLQRLIAWLAYEEGRYDFAAATLRTVKRQAGEGWREQDEAFLRVFEEARERGTRLPLPAEPGPPPSPAPPSPAPPPPPGP